VAVVIFPVVFVIFSEVREGRIVAVAEAFAVFVAVGWGNGGMAVFPAPVHVRITVVFEVVAAGFDAIVEAPALHIAELLGRCIPAAAIMVWVILAISILRVVLGRAVLGHEHGGRSQCKSKRWKSESIDLHC
jgi:hypothetical protein